MGHLGAAAGAPRQGKPAGGPKPLPPVHTIAYRQRRCHPSLVAPDGRCVGHTAYGEGALLVVDLDPGAATGSYARRYAPERYGD